MAEIVSSGSEGNSGAQDTSVVTSSSSTSDVSSENNTQSAEDSSQQVSSVTTPAYTPNLKFKYYKGGENQVEEEFPEWARPIVKDPTTEKTMRDLFERAYGLDHVKMTRDSIRKEMQGLQSERNNFNKSLNMLNTYVRSGDFDSFFESLGIPEDTILKYAIKKAEYRQLPADKRAEIDQARTAQSKAALFESEANDLRQSYSTMESKVRGMELDQALTSSDVQSVSSFVDSKLGQGAFKREVINRGALHWHTHKEDLPVQQAIAEALQVFKGFIPTQAAPVPGVVESPEVESVEGGEVETLQMPSQTTQQKPAVIPNVKGGSASPVKRVPKSIDDLRKLANSR